MNFGLPGGVPAHLVGRELLRTSRLGTVFHLDKEDLVANGNEQIWTPRTNFMEMLDGAACLAQSGYYFRLISINAFCKSHFVLSSNRRVAPFVCYRMRLRSHRVG